MVCLIRLVFQGDGMRLNEQFFLSPYVFKIRQCLNDHTMTLGD